MMEEHPQIFKSLNMEEVKFEDLRITLGKPCIYRHHKSCDHMFIFNDLR
jgi:snRNA-activating protein of 50kDa MW C terminal.